LLGALALAGLDLFVKYWISLHLNLRPATDFSINKLTPSTAVINQTLTGGQSFTPLIFMGLLLAFFLLLYLLSAMPGKLSWLSATLLLAAVFGNGSERLLTGGIIDYWLLAFPNHLYLVINLADIFALAGLLLMPFYFCQSLRQRPVKKNYR